MDGVTVYLNGVRYYFKSTDALVLLLDSNCDDMGSASGIDGIIEYDKE